MLHCIAHYPTEPNETNLFAMETIRNKFHLPVGYSDNGESLLVDIVAVRTMICIGKKRVRGTKS